MDIRGTNVRNFTDAPKLNVKYKAWTIRQQMKQEN